MTNPVYVLIERKLDDFLIIGVSDDPFDIKRWIETTGVWPGLDQDNLNAWNGTDFLSVTLSDGNQAIVTIHEYGELPMGRRFWYGHG